VRSKIALWICPAIKSELDALRSGNTKIVLENGKLLDELERYRRRPTEPTNAFRVMAHQFGLVETGPVTVNEWETAEPALAQTNGERQDV
jgi:hypothetical protein